MLLENIRLILVIVCIVLLALFLLKEKQETKLNWALFYGGIWMSFTLPIANYVCVQFNLWDFLIDENLIKIPYDILFIWLFLWMLPFYFFRGKYMLIIILVLLWIDTLTMPILEDYGIVKLNKNWLVGEFILIAIVFLPNYLWAKFSLQEKYTGFRALMQVATMSLFLLVVIPFSVKIYETGIFAFENFSIIYFQVIYIIAFPSFMAVIDLVNEGGGTPFPYDKTKNLVKTGVYAYIKNPIQWSFTTLFIPLAFYHHSYFLLLGIVISLAYTIGVSNSQEYEDMEKRFGESWISYKTKVPSWYFQWRPRQIPKGTIYFKKNCSECEDVRKWFVKQELTNLNISYSEEYVGEELLQVTYKNYLGQKFKSIEAIAHGLEHINLAYASLGWFMRFPFISILLQIIIDAFGYTSKKNNCEINKI